MDFAGDRRAQSVQVGVIVLFGFLVLAYSGYQAEVVPQQNEEIEFEHNQDVQADVTDLRSAILRSASERGTRSVSVQLGTNYPSRSIFVNPASPSGRLQTVGTSDASVAVDVDNADATDDETGDFWDGTTTRSYSTGGLAYTPLYNYYREAPTTVYDNTVAANQFDPPDRATSGQALVDGRRITLVTLDGELSENGVGSASVDVSGVSASETRVTVSDDGGPVTVSFPTTLDESTWRDLLADQIDESDSKPDAYVASFDYTTGDPATVTLEFERGVDYELSLARVGVGSGATAPDEAYAVDVAGDGATIQEGSNQQVVVEVRDRFNNPVSGVTVDVESPPEDRTGTPQGRVDGAPARTDADGRAEFTYEAPANVNGNKGVTFEIGFGGGDAEKAEFTVTVQDTDTGGNSAPTADFSYAPTSPSAGEAIDFDASLSADSDGSITTYEWDWTSDRTYDDTGETATHSYSSDGDYDVTLRVTDNGGATDTETKTVTVGSGGGGDNPPSASIDDIRDNSQCSDLSGGGNCVGSASTNLAEFEVDWSATDDNGISDVTLELVDSGGTVQDRATPTASGTSASGTETLSDEGGYGDDYTIRLVVTDSIGQTSSDSVSDTADGTDP